MSSEYEVGMKARRTVLGDDYVDQVMRETTTLTRDFQQLLTKYCWGSVWARRGLSWRDRSLINIAMLVALNRPHELRLHIKGAIRNGCSVAEISEVLLQAAIYCGIPAGAAGYAIAAEVLGDGGLRGDGANAGDPTPAPG